MKRGGRLLVVSILSLVLLLVTSIGIVSPNVRAVPDDNATTADEQTDNNSDNENTDGNESTDGEEGNADEETCEAGAHGFGWVLCPGQNLITDIFGFFLRFIARSARLYWSGPY